MEKLKKITGILLVTMAIVTTMLAAVYDHAFTAERTPCDGYARNICYTVTVIYPDKTFYFEFYYRDWVMT
jgi:hypothetical protein